MDYRTMRLVKKYFGKWLQRKPQTALTVKINRQNLKRAVAVSDAYWNELYEPIIRVVETCLGCIQISSGGLSSASKLNEQYASELTSIIGALKGIPGKNSLDDHINNYSVFISFSTLFISKRMNKVNFTFVENSKSGDKRTIQVFPWDACTETLNNVQAKRKNYLPPIYCISVPVLFRMLSGTGRNWLQSQPDKFCGVLEAVFSNGEKGLYSGPLSLVIPSKSDSPTLDGGISLVGQSPTPSSHTDESSEASLDDLISKIGGGTSSGDKDFEALLEGNRTGLGTTPSMSPEDEFAALLEGKAKAPESASQKPGISSEPVSNEQSIEDEFTTLLEGKAKAPEPASQKPGISSEPVSNEQSIEDEFAALLEGKAKAPEPASQKPGISSEPVSNEQSIEDEFTTLLEGKTKTPKPVPNQNYVPTSPSLDLIRWAISEKNHGGGVFNVVLDDGELVLGLRVGDADIDVVTAFVRSDYDLDSEADVSKVRDEIIYDLNLSDSWICNEHGEMEHKVISQKGKDIVSAILVRCDDWERSQFDTYTFV
ncbi:hypothetical protein [Shewanella sp. Iso12]|uniref:hypothetical protein n=1 Tax=Shewanella sp. Iso12 TaxID=1826753 RepID=UPI001432072D|nr:hypothetical protein [Shewanella sp. Iso12]NJI86980.1 hypothetical protein [Shewanella sp. Iso12]